MVIERRQSKRFSVRSNAFALFKSKPDKLIPIVNISRGGMGIGVNGINMNTDGLSKVSRLEILTDDCRFYMDQLAYQLLWWGLIMTFKVSRPAMTIRKPSAIFCNGS